MGSRDSDAELPIGLFKELSPWAPRRWTRAPGMLASSENSHTLSGHLPFLGLPLSPAAHLGRLAPREVGMWGRYRLMGARRPALVPV